MLLQFKVLLEITHFALSYIEVILNIIFFELDTILVSVIGIRTSSLGLSEGETWIHHMLVQHPGAIVFLVLDTFIFIVAVTLTSTQASMVSAQTFLKM